MKSRILIIGLDGASPHLVEKWRDKLPNLSRLMAEGCFGTLESVNPPRSVPAWYCLATGMNPARLGVFGFSQRLPGTYDYTFANLSFCRAPTFWQWLNRQGLKTAVIHVPGTFPPHPVEGALVSGWPAPLNRGNLTYTSPPALGREIDRLLGRPFEFLSDRPMRTDNDGEMLAERRRILQMHGDVAMHVLANYEWDVGLVVLSPVDRASHQFWRHLDPTHPAYDEAEGAIYGDALQQVYQAADEQVGRLLTLPAEGDTLFIVSDHGFGPAYRTFYLNEWLLQKGYLVLKDSDGKAKPKARSRLIGRLAAPLFRLNNASPLFRRLLDPLKKRALSNFLRDEYVRAKASGVVRLNHLPVDWGRTRAYCPDEGSLYLNLRGRDPGGIVAPGAEAEALLREIMAGLANVADFDTGETVPVQLTRKEEIYEGPFLADAPDLLVAMDGYTTEVMAELGSGRLFEPNSSRSGTHNMEGLFIARGPGIRAGGRFDARLLDIAPTVAHLAGAAVPDDVDGEVLLPLFNEQSDMRLREVRTSEASLPGDGASHAYTAEEMAQVEQQLRDLGYLN